MTDEGQSQCYELIYTINSEEDEKVRKIYVMANDSKEAIMKAEAHLKRRYPQTSEHPYRKPDISGLQMVGEGVSSETEINN